MHLYLIGFMGSGKSYTGRQLAKKLKLDFVDLDDLIEERAEKTIAEIFAEEGEMNFRLMESAALKSIGSQDDLVIACGGGTPCFLDNMDWILADGLSIFLDTPIPMLLERLKPELEKRPLLQGKNEEELSLFLEEKIAERLPFYRRANIIYQQKKGSGQILEDLQRRIEAKK